MLKAESYRLRFFVGLLKRTPYRVIPSVAEGSVRIYAVMVRNTNWFLTALWQQIFRLRSLSLTSLKMTREKTAQDDKGGFVLRSG